jgi:hypothetical protein
VKRLAKRNRLVVSEKVGEQDEDDEDCADDCFGLWHFKYWEQFVGIESGSEAFGLVARLLQVGLTFSSCDGVCRIVAVPFSPNRLNQTV